MISASALVVGFILAGVIWTVIAILTPEDEPDLCRHDWTRHGYCADCGAQTLAMSRSRENHPAGKGRR